MIIYWHNKQVKTIKGQAVEEFLATVDELDESIIQLTLAKLTGNFKRGNEHHSNSH